MDCRYFSLNRMHLSLARVFLWGSRLLSVALALWWPALWRDPIYTPRQARLSSQEPRLPDGIEPATADGPALAIFWRWEHRTLVTSRWAVGPYRGLREPEGRTQTLLAMAVVWGVSSGILWLGARLASSPPAERQRGKGLIALLTTPLWQLLTRPRRDHLP